MHVVHVAPFFPEALGELPVTEANHPTRRAFREGPEYLTSSRVHLIVHYTYSQIVGQGLIGGRKELIILTGGRIHEVGLKLAAVAGRRLTFLE